MDEQPKFRVRRADGDPRLTVSEQETEAFINWSYERDPDYYDAVFAYHYMQWVLFGVEPPEPS